MGCEGGRPITRYRALRPKPANQNLIVASSAIVRGHYGRKARNRTKRIDNMTTILSRRGLVGALVIAGVGTGVGPVRAADAAVNAMQTYYSRLVATMRQASSLNVQSRYQRLAPILASAFDFSTMTRLSVGPAFHSASGGQQAALRQAFERFMGAYYANRIDGYSGEQFEVDPAVENRGGGKVIKTRLVRPGGGGSTEIDYLMSGTRVIDIYLDGTISEVAARRSEFASIMASGGTDALLRALHEKTASLLGG
jgi:phospholipid transport system substrate-binding protein